MIVAVPAETGDTRPEALIVATAVLLLLHVPPPTVSLSDEPEPTQNDEGPVMIPAVAIALTVTGKVAEDVPQLVVTV